MNWKQKVCLFAGITIAAGALVYPPIDIEVGNLRFYLGLPCEELTTTLTVHRFMPEGGIKAINWRVLGIEWLVIGALDCALVILFRSKVERKAR